MPTPIVVVVVDDDENDRYLVGRAVKKIPYNLECVEFEAGDAFLETIVDKEKRSAALGNPPPPVLVLLDINMPRMSGLEVLEELNKFISAEDRIVVVTMYTSSDYAVDRTSASESSLVKEYVVKPISAARLQELVEEYCLAE